MKSLYIPAIIALTFISRLQELAHAAPVPSAFTYQGRLGAAGQPANGSYDLQFTLRDAADGGAVNAGPVTMEDVNVQNGLFTVTLDFGAGAFGAGARWLEIGVRPGPETGAFTALSPLQAVTGTPVAVHSLRAGIADSATTAQTAISANTAATAQTAGNVTWNNVSGLPAGFSDGVDNDTTYAAGPGLTLGAGNQFALNFGGSGSQLMAARSDHNHFGQTWTGSLIGSGLNLFNSTTNGRALTGKQGTGSGYTSLSGITTGVWGDSHDGWGLFGSSFDGAGVYGLANDTEYNANATYGGCFRNNGYGYGLFASSARGQGAHFEAPVTNSQPALVASALGTGHAGLFTLNNPANSNDAVSAQTNGSGDGVSGINSGTGHAARFQISSAANTTDAVFVQTIGSGDGVHALATGEGNGIDGRSSGSGSAVYARSTGAGAALELDGGALKITGAGQNTTTPAFIHQSSLSNFVKDEDAGVLRTRINHALCNNKPDAILIVTPRGHANFDSPFGVEYIASEGAWSITMMGAYFESFTIGTKFNVLVINP
ncbi:MAG TPA: hypothetical protein VG796_08585 [Verrucomicrobiales bacterium]|nr:hypothetical protein [Verrucomicrobiales bacterium]